MCWGDFAQLSERDDLLVCNTPEIQLLEQVDVAGQALLLTRHGRIGHELTGFRCDQSCDGGEGFAQVEIEHHLQQ